MKKYMGLKEALARVEAHGETKDDLLNALRRQELHALKENHRVRDYHGTVIFDNLSPGAWVGSEAWSSTINWENGDARWTRGKGWDEQTEEVLGIYILSAEVDRIWPPIGPQKEQQSHPGYVTPHIYLMLEAIQHFGISPDRPPVVKKQIVDWLMERGLPDGTVIEKTLAEHMATCCRPTDHQKGGRR